jgi:acyl-CoA thioesterase
MQELMDALLGGNPAEVQQVSFIGRELFIVGQHLDALGREAAGGQLLAHEFAGSQEHVHAAIVGSQPFV